MKYIQRTWNVLSVMAWITVIGLGIHMYQNNERARNIEIESYNSWVTDIRVAESYLNSAGPYEKPNGNPGEIGYNPNLALFTAEKFIDEARARSGEASMIFQGKVGDTFSKMEQTSQNLNDELNILEDYGTYSGSVLEFRQVKTAIADRNFMYGQIKNTVLAGMPATVTSIQQIREQWRHLNQINSQANNGIGNSSSSFEKFAQSTGQMNMG